jgi:hypothetical protein
MLSQRPFHRLGRNSWMASQSRYWWRTAPSFAERKNARKATTSAVMLSPATYQVQSVAAAPEARAATRSLGMNRAASTDRETAIEPQAASTTATVAASRAKPMAQAVRAVPTTPSES